ncbi:hypothetical protein HDU85_003920 [Gaertneriomyces sp. JEL0708]|nr:hypothetical protein HDU85_003920 [Gaertneriomyces sp. JEL0708]
MENSSNNPDDAPTVRRHTESDSSTDTGSWGGWGWNSLGSAISDAVNSVSVAIEKVDLSATASALGTNIRNTAHTVYEALDPDSAAEQASQASTERARGDHDTRELDDNGNRIQASPTEEAAHTAPSLNIPQGAASSVGKIFSKIDASFDAASQSIVSTLAVGYKKIEDAKLGEKAKHTLHEVTREIKESTKASVNAFESLGKEAVHFFEDALGAKEDDHEAARRYADATGEVTISILFDKGSGSDHLQSLEMLSTESHMRFDAARGDERPSAELASVLDLLSSRDNANATDLAETGAMEEMAIGVDSDAQVQSIVSLVEAGQTYKDNISDIYSADAPSATSEEGTSDVEDVTKEFLASTYGIGMNALATCAELSCEQILHIAQALLHQVETRRTLADGQAASSTVDETNERTSVMENARATRSLVLWMIKETSQLCDLYVSALESVASSYRTRQPEMVLESGILVEDKMHTLQQSLRADADYVTARIHQAAEALLPMFQLLWFIRWSQRADMHTGRDVSGPAL